MGEHRYAYPTVIETRRNAMLTSAPERAVGERSSEPPPTPVVDPAAGRVQGHAGDRDSW
jgi:hypothetical protein